MDLLDVVRGPLLAVAMSVFLAGVAWRLLALYRLPRPAAPGGAAAHAFGHRAAFTASLRRFAVPSGFSASATLVTLNPYVFHLGLLVVVAGYAPHIAFLRRHTGIGWTALPDAVIYLAAAATIVSLLLALMFRLTDPVLQRISRADDKLSWALTFLPFVTGMALVAQPSAAMLQDHVVYRGPLAVHLLSVELLLVWFPFGKLMHAFLVLPARMQLATFFGRRGVRS